MGVVGVPFLVNGSGVVAVNDLEAKFVATRERATLGNAGYALGWVLRVGYVPDVTVPARVWLSIDGSEGGS